MCAPLFAALLSGCATHESETASMRSAWYAGNTQAAQARVVPLANESGPTDELVWLLEEGAVTIGGSYGPTSLVWSGEPVVIPASLIDHPGFLPVGIVGYGDGGKVRVLTAAADCLLKVVPSGPYEGDEPVPDPTDVLGQLLEARDEALEAAQRAEEAADYADGLKRGTQVSVTDGRPTVGGMVGDSAIDPSTGIFYEFVDTDATTE